jgi:hypothetical protein
MPRSIPTWGTVMHNDDNPVGAVLTRREIIGLAGAAGIAWIGRGASALAATSTFEVALRMS